MSKRVPDHEKKMSIRKRLIVSALLLLGGSFLPGRRGGRGRRHPSTENLTPISLKQISPCDFLHTELQLLRQTVAHALHNGMISESEGMLFGDAYLSELLSDFVTVAAATSALEACFDWRKSTLARSLRSETYVSTHTVQSSMWTGVDDESSPVLLLQPGRRSWRGALVAEEFLAHMALVEQGLHALPRDVARIVCVQDTRGMGAESCDLTLAKCVVKGFLQGHPARLKAYYIGPVGWWLRTVFAVVKPLLPGNLRHRVHLLKDPAEHLEAIMHGNRELLEQLQTQCF
ncbi:hypothetical protein CYMTET_13466 [Cymbomonas tetramitiformis]|uniref:CRAL-TRIO domain-containing protein n=1 Tax=Cymbomonas tetramitiformis TaxID=36881 RepID=A0AAE0GIF2_9CHLO|nr:hypothetical protein CYMTET_13466 [Cymbomonas tetramitiformis]